MPLATTGRTPSGLDLVACVLCGSRRTRPLYRKYDLSVVRCRGCGLVFVNPRLPPEAVGRRYSREYFWDEYLPAAGAPGGRVDLDFVDRHFAPWVEVVSAATGGSGRVFEIGAGAGLLLEAFARAGWTAAGIDVNPDAAAFARDRLGLDVAHADTAGLERPDGQFDAVLMVDVIEHLADPLDAATRARRLLRPGGVLLVETPNFGALSRRAIGLPWSVLNPVEHLYYFTEATLGRLLRKAGFREVRFERRFAGYLLHEAMNYRRTQAPRALRSRAYALLVEKAAGRLFEWAIAHKATDQLICVAGT